MPVVVILVILSLVGLWLLASKFLAIPAANLIKKIVNMFREGK